MRLPKATDVLAQYIMDEEPHDLQDLIDACKLSREALLAINDFRADWEANRFHALPGETLAPSGEPGAPAPTEQRSSPPTELDRLISYHENQLFFHRYLMDPSTIQLQQETVKNLKSLRDLYRTGA